MLCSTFLYETYARAIFSLKKNLTAPAFTEGLFVPTPWEPRLPLCLHACLVRSSLRYLAMKKHLTAAGIGNTVTQLLEEPKQKQERKNYKQQK